MNIKISILCLFLLSLVNSCEQKPSNEVQVISADEMQTLMNIEEAQLVDVRTPEEYEQGHIDNSQNIDFRSPTFDEDIAKLDKSKPIVLYCNTGKRSAKCAAKMRGLGFVKLYDLDGGISQWKYEGNTVKTFN